MLSIGIVGLPNVGKSTLFKALTKKQVDIQNYPFCTIEPNIGIVAVPDQRLRQLSEFSKSRKTVPAAIEFIDIAGLVAGAHKGEGLGNQFLANIRETDAILQVVRAFEDANITHVGDKPEPWRDTEIISYELIFKDLETARHHLPKAEKRGKAGEKDAPTEIDFLRKLIDWLEKGNSANTLPVGEKKMPFLKQLNLLSAKPILYLINCASNKPTLDYPTTLKPALELDIKLENELSELPEKEAAEMRQALPRTKDNIDELISACYTLLGLETFFTSGEQESRAWTIKKGTRAPQAAGEIHTDFEKGFIRADVIYWEKLINAVSWAKAREQGLIRTEGKEYVVQDGDTIIFKFN